MLNDACFLIDPEPRHLMSADVSVFEYEIGAHVVTVVDAELVISFFECFKMFVVIIWISAKIRTLTFIKAAYLKALLAKHS